MCLELVAWKPRRNHAADREPTRWVIGVTNYDKCTGLYWAIAEVDRRLPLEELLNSIPVWVGRPLIVFRTRKGYHVYLSLSSHNPLKIYHLLMRTKIFDRGHLKLAKARPEEDYGKLVLRISPKYSEPDIYPVFIAKGLSLWHQQVLYYTAMMQTGKLDVEEVLRKAHIL